MVGPIVLMRRSAAHKALFIVAAMAGIFGYTFSEANQTQLLELITAILCGRKPNLPTCSVCVECKRRGHVCVMVAHGTACLGPVTHAGCGAICPAYDRGCYACFGPKENPNTRSLAGWLEDELTVSREQICRLFRTFNADAKAFRQEGSSREEA